MPAPRPHIGLLCLAFAACAEREPPAATDANSELSNLQALGYAGYEEQPEADPIAVAPASPLAADSGPLLFTDEKDRVTLLARDGTQLWSLRVPGRDQVELAEPLEGGRLATLSVDQGVDLFAPSGEHLASWDLASHHDLAADHDGSLLVLAHAEHLYYGRNVRFDSVVRVFPDAPDRDPEQVWSSFESHLSLLPLAGLSALEKTPTGNPTATIYDRFHANSLQVLPPDAPASLGPGNWLLCLRNASLILVLDPTTGYIRWHFEAKHLDFPHHPSLLPNGRILLFDNGWQRGFSRLLELDAVTPFGIAWSWSSPQPESFFSKTRGAVERLPNGGTLVTNSESGHLFELDAKGRLSWEYRNPLAADGRRRRIYRATRPTDSWVDQVLSSAKR
ncbi:MAG: outer membrane protein assembly factor BamB [Planctomycetota bacterium]|jgi:outer membrane protein assembly factor BamB